MNKKNSPVFLWALLSAATLFQQCLQGLSQPADSEPETKPIKIVISNISQGLDLNTTFAKSLEEFKSKIKLIYPGTKWCGAGNTADSDKDLGTFSTTDQCCRDHDQCFDSIEAGESEHGLDNKGFFTRSHCDCDSELYSCLEKADNAVATSLGCTYFTILGPQCFKEDYPIVGCEKQKLGRCVEYKTDETGEKKYQWFDNPTFSCI